MYLWKNNPWAKARKLKMLLSMEQTKVNSVYRSASLYLENWEKAQAKVTDLLVKIVRLEQENEKLRLERVLWSNDS